MTAIVPTRDRPLLLLRALQAIADQDYPGDIHVLVVFDQAEPGVALPGDRPGRTFRATSNRRTPGLAGARNTGLVRADTRLVAFCDDDDEWLPHKLTTQVRALQESTGGLMVVAGIEVQYGTATAHRLPKTPRVSHRDLLRSRCSELHPSTFVAERAAVMTRIGLVDEEIPGSFAEDYDWLLRAATAADIVAVQEPLVRVHWHEASHFANRWGTMVSALSYVIRKHPDLHTEPVGLARLEGQIAFFSVAGGDVGSGVHWAWRSLRHNPLEGRGYLALAAAARLLPPGSVLRWLHRRGHGI